MPPVNSKLYRFFRYGDLWLVVGLLGTVLLLILPIPTFLLDTLLAVSIALSLLTMLVILYLKEPSDFTGFPSLLLFITLFRLALNVASTRFILLDRYAGHIIEAFGNFVVRGNFVVGLIIFLILVLINFVVITKGAGRIAEVAARFTLDAMPGKQMAIDADLNAGIIEEKEAKRRRARIQQEADFYGAMDGASKFVRGDAIAGLVITAVNIVGGLVIGVFQAGMDIRSALNTYTVLTVGDGLVAQMPALIVSVAAGIAVTKASVDEALSENLKKQLLGNNRALIVTAAVLFGIALIPGMPHLPLIIVAAMLGGLGWIMEQNRKLAQVQTAEAEALTARKEAEAAPEDIDSLLPIDRLGFELGYGLIP